MNKLKLYTCKSCGAVGIDDGTGEVKWAGNLEVFNKITGLNITKKDLKNALLSYYGCDYCINHWGMDLCQCGSGEKVNECACGCGLPSQTYKKEERRALWVY